MTAREWGWTLSLLAIPPALSFLLLAYWPSAWIVIMVTTVAVAIGVTGWLMRERPGEGE